jgi:hypothetical protein
MSISREIEVLYRDKDKLLPAPAELLKVLRGWSWNFGQQFLLQPGPSAVDLDDGAASNGVVHGPRLARARRRDPRGERPN